MICHLQINPLSVQALSPSLVSGVTHAVLTEAPSTNSVAVGLAYNAATFYPSAFACLRRWGAWPENKEHNNTGKNTGNVLRVRTLFQSCRLALFLLFLSFSLSFIQPTIFLAHFISIVSLILFFLVVSWDLPETVSFNKIKSADKVQGSVPAMGQSTVCSACGCVLDDVKYVVAEGGVSKDYCHRNCCPQLVGVKTKQAQDEDDIIDLTFEDATCQL